MEKRIKELEVMVQKQNEVTDRLQGQIFKLLQELNKYKERDRQIE